MTGIAHAMAVMVRATGQYNYSCSVFVEGKPAGRASALAFAQVYAAVRLTMTLAVYSLRGSLRLIKPQSTL
jgi:hypothetical protein